MQKRIINLAVTILLTLVGAANAATNFVITTSPTGLGSLTAAIAALNDGDTVAFLIPGLGPHYIVTPTGGYPRITNNNVTIDGYTQPLAVPNTNPILANNNAQIKIVLTSTNGNFTDMGYDPTNPNAGYGPGEGAVLGILNASNVTVRGLCILGAAPANQAFDGIGVAREYAGGAVGLGNGLHVSGCWIGVDLGGTAADVHGFNHGIGAPRHQDNVIGNASRLPSNRHVIGVKAGSADSKAEFNIIVGSTINVILEGQAHRISGNFIGVLPSGNEDFIPPLAYAGTMIAEAAIEIGRGASDLIIGVDGDGVNDADERNVMGGMLLGPEAAATPGLTSWGAYYTAGYRHVIEFYSLSSSPGSDRQRNRISGNYICVGVDGVTRFTNSCPAFNGSAATSDVIFGSDFDGVSDDLEGNVYNGNHPGVPGLFYATSHTNSINQNHGFFDEPDQNSSYSTRGNKVMNGYPYPVNPQRGTAGLFTFTVNYVNKALAVAQPNTEAGFHALKPVISASSSTARLVGTAPANNATYPYLIMDLYIPDSEGLTNGLVVPDPNLTNGWVHGLIYLGSFLDNGPYDVNPAAGQLDLDISSLALAADTQVTMSANYSKDPPGTHNARVLTSLFANPVSLPIFIPGGVASVGLTHVVNDVILWSYTNGVDGSLYFATNGPVNTTSQVANQGNWEPYASVLGDSTFLISQNTYAADDVTDPSMVIAPAGAGPPYQRYTVALQPAAGGAPVLGEAFYTDAGAPYRRVINFRRNNGNPMRVAGDKRYGAVNFLTMAETSAGQIPAFKSNTRWTNNPSYDQSTANAYVTVQPFSLNPLTLAQTPLANAFDPIYGNFVTATAPVTQTQVSRTGGRPEVLDNGNMVVVSDDRTGYLDPDTEYTSFSIITPSGAVVKSATLVDLGDIWDNAAAFRGGFAIRVANLIYLYNNAGTLTFTIDISATSGLSFGGGRQDGSRVGSDIRSYYVYLAGRTPDSVTSPVTVAIWDSRTGNFVTKATVSQTDPATHSADRVSIGVDALDRFCVAYPLRPTSLDFPSRQVVARVGKFDGTNISFLTHTFFAFVNYENDPNSLVGLQTFHPNVTMTPRQICIAARGQVNSTNNPAGGPDTLGDTINLYTVISHPAPVAAPQPQMTITTSGSSLVISWLADAGLFVLQSATAVAGPYNDVGPQPTITRVGSGDPNDRYQMTFPAPAANTFYRLLRRW